VKLTSLVSIIVATASFTCACGSIGAAGDRNADLVLPPKQVAALKQKAFAGDGAAAYRLFMHYSVGHVDRHQGEQWLRLAIRLGDKDAKKAAQEWRIAQPSDYARFERDHTLPPK
jgi:hypothetical protein